ncbi:hypothetical protein SPRG_13126, partial [Saprolegnia parasitica CBS 223.65]
MANGECKDKGVCARIDTCTWNHPQAEKCPADDACVQQTCPKNHTKIRCVSVVLGKPCKKGAACTFYHTKPAVYPVNGPIHEAAASAPRTATPTGEPTQCTTPAEQRQESAPRPTQQAPRQEQQPAAPKQRQQQRAMVPPPPMTVHLPARSLGDRAPVRSSSEEDKFRQREAKAVADHQRLLHRVRATPDATRDAAVAELESQLHVFKDIQAQFSMATKDDKYRRKRELYRFQQRLPAYAKRDAIERAVTQSRFVV